MKLSEHINIFSKARAYKIIIRKSVAFLLTNINAEKEVIKSNSITIASNKKYWNNPNQEGEEPQQLKL